MSDFQFSQKEVEFAQLLPKIELHLHLDGSLSPEFMAQEALKAGIELPAPTQQLRAWLQTQKTKAIKKDNNRVEKDKNWKIFDFCNQFLQTKDQLINATLDLCQRLAGKNVVYAEIRFCPELHTSKGLTSEEALIAVLTGFRQQQALLGGIIICALRSKDIEHGLKMARLAGQYLQRKKADPIGVIGFDVAGDEGNFPLNSKDCSMVPGISEARRLGVPLTLHAGEWPPERFETTLSNLKFAIDEIKVNRIGHAIAFRCDIDYLQSISSAQPPTVEVCLTSNVGNGFKVQSYEQHPVKLLEKSGIPYAFCMDNWLLSGDALRQPDPNTELLIASKLVGWKAVKKALINGALSAFSPQLDSNWIDAFRKTLDRLFDEKQQ